MRKILKTIGLCIGLPIIVIAIMIAMQEIFMLIINDSDKVNEFSMLISFLTYVIFLPLFYSVTCVKDKSLLEQLDIKKIDKKEIVYIIFFGIGISFILSILTGMLTMIFPSYLEVSDALLQSNNSIMNIILVVILIPICEELLFRGIIFKYLKENYHIVTAVILQALAFGVYHGNIVQGIYTFVLGIALALIYMYSESIIGCIILHMIYNLFGTVVMHNIMSDNVIANLIILVTSIILFVFSIVKMAKKYEKELYKTLYED